MAHKKYKQSCPSCGTTLYRQKGREKQLCRVCFYKSLIGKKKHMTMEGSEVLRKHALSITRNHVWLKGENSPTWKGDSVKREGLHQWVYRWLGRITECAFCGKDGKTDWASISHHAHRDLNDFIPLCRMCHIHYDRFGETP